MGNGPARAAQTCRAYLDNAPARLPRRPRRHAFRRCASSSIVDQTSILRAPASSAIRRFAHQREADRRQKTPADNISDAHCPRCAGGRPSVTSATSRPSLARDQAVIPASPACRAMPTGPSFRITGRPFAVVTLLDRLDAGSSSSKIRAASFEHQLLEGRDRDDGSIRERLPLSTAYAALVRRVPRLIANHLPLTRLA